MYVVFVFERLGIDVRCLCLCYYYYILYLIYYTIILYLILHSSYSSDLLSFLFFLLLFLPQILSPPPFLSSPIPPLLIFLTIQSFSPSSSSPNILFPSQPFYTCRVFHILIYIPSSSRLLTPHVLSEWMVEVCRFY